VISATISQIYGQIRVNIVYLNFGWEYNKSGFTVIQTLIAIILLGLVSTMGIMVFNQLWGNKAILLKKEAFGL
jgi:type II secretory pathway component PulJ